MKMVLNYTAQKNKGIFQKNIRKKHFRVKSTRPLLGGLSNPLLSSLVLSSGYSQKKTSFEVLPSKLFPRVTLSSCLHQK